MFLARRGFTLLEVLISLAIFVLMAIVLGGAYINVLNGYAAVARATQRDQDVKFARTMVLTEPDLDTVEKGGDFDGTDNRHVKWTVAVEQTPTPDLFNVTFDCEISAPDLKQPEKVHEVFRLLRPTWSKPSDRDQLKLQDRQRIQQLLQKKTA
jgi:general secretion pathway protein I